MSVAFPPRQKDWSPGHTQLGIFIRTKQGGQIRFVSDSVDEDMLEFALCLLSELKGIPKQLVKDVIKARQAAEKLFAR